MSKLKFLLPIISLVLIITFLDFISVFFLQFSMLDLLQEYFLIGIFFGFKQTREAIPKLFDFWQSMPVTIHVGLILLYICLGIFLVDFAKYFFKRLSFKPLKI
jgi:hypothetical protein